MITLRKISQLHVANDSANLADYYSPGYDTKTGRNVRFKARFFEDKLNELKSLLR